MSEVNEGVVVPGETTPADIEEMATGMGWNPEGVEGKRNLTAEEFIDRQPLYDDIRSLKKQTRKLQAGVDALRESHSQVAAATRDSVIKELHEQKKYALENENYDDVIEIDDKIAAERANVTEEPSTNAEFETWADANEWYHQDNELREYADTIGARYLQKNPKKDLADVYEYVRKETEARYPDKFGGNAAPDTDGNRRRSTPVEGAGRGRSSGSTRYSARDLPDDHRRIMENVVKSTGMTREQYLKDYFG